MKKYYFKTVHLILLTTMIFIIFIVGGFYFGSKYIKKQLLISDENTAIDIALLMKNNFSISDAEVAYMKSLSFNQMEVDSINLRLMNVCNKVKMNSHITNVYIISALDSSEIKYKTDAQTSDFFCCNEDTELNGIWLLNGNFNENGEFLYANREDIYRYTKLSESQENGIALHREFGEISSDSWGEFITGYTPIYSKENNFIGLLGVDISLDKYQLYAEKMTSILFLFLFIIIFVTVALFLYFYFKYILIKKNQLYFEFYSKMSHKMRTPMNGILGMANLSKEEKDINVLHDNINKIEESGFELLGLINNLLDMNNISFGILNLNFESKKISNLAENQIQNIKVEADRKKINFKFINENVDLEKYLYVDEKRLQQIFTKLLFNAIKFSDEGGTVIFSIKSLRSKKGISRIKLTVSDIGIGMSHHFIKNHLFKPYEQEQKFINSESNGIGLSLYIVKNIVELMNGSIKVKSRINKGTSIEVFLNLKESDVI